MAKADLPPNLASVKTLLILIPLPPDLLKALERRFTCHYHPFRFPEESGHKVDIPDQILGGVEVIFALAIPRYITREKVPKLIWVQTISAGFDVIRASPLFHPSDSSKPPLLTGTSGVHARVIGEHVISVSLALFHRLNWLAIKGWNEKKWVSVFGIKGIGGVEGVQFIRELRGQTMGVLGYGHIGRESARLAKGFGMNVIACNSRGVKSAEGGFIQEDTGDPDGSIPSAWYSSKDPSAFREFLSKTDVLVITLPATPETHHIISSTTISHLPSSSIIINVGRGSLVDTDALVAALRSNQIGGASLDVTDPEPLPEGHELWGFDNVLITPHVSFASGNLFQAILDLFGQQVDRIRSNQEPYNIFDPERGY